MARIFKIIVGILFLGLMGYFIYSHFSNGRAFLTLIERVNPVYLLLAIAIQIAYYLSWVSLFRDSFRLFGIDWTYRSVIKNYFRAYAIGLMTPLGGSAGMGVYVSRAKEDNVSSTTTLAAVLTGTFVFYIEVILLWILNYFVMRINGWLNIYQVTAFAILLIIVLVAVLLLAIGVFVPQLIEAFLRFIQWLRNIWRRISGKKPQLVDWAVQKSTEFIGISSIIVKQRQGLLMLFRDSFSIIIFSAVTFFLLFLGLGYVMPVSQLLAGISITLLFSIVSPTPQGIGIVEPLLISTFLSFGIDDATASVASLGFRVFTVWIPVLFGVLLSMREVRRRVLEQIRK